MTGLDQLADRSAVLRQWLLDDAFPLWAEYGVDRSMFGGFHELLDDDRQPIPSRRRARLVARQIYCFTAAERLGWHGPTRELVDHGLEFLLRRLVSEDGMVLSSVAGDDDAASGQDLYDYAFVLFALAWAHRLYPDKGLDARAARILMRLNEQWRNPAGGFVEPGDSVGSMRSNPHMHLLEAALEWRELDSPQNGGPWSRLVDELTDLAVDRLISAETGAIAEYFDRRWTIESERHVVEPGHQFEWAWLLDRRSGRTVDAEMRDRIVQLVRVGEGSGTDHRRGVAVSALDGDSLRVIDPDARLWSQTERIKAWVSIARRGWGIAAGSEYPLEWCARAVDGLLVYRHGKPPGMWNEQLGPDDRFNGEPTRASSLYHAVVAATELDGFVRSQKAG